MSSPGRSTRRRQVSKRMQEYMEERHSKRRKTRSPAAKSTTITKEANIDSSPSAAEQSTQELVTNSTAEELEGKETATPTKQPVNSENVEIPSASEETEQLSVGDEILHEETRQPNESNNETILIGENNEMLYVNNDQSNVVEEYVPNEMGETIITEINLQNQDQTVGENDAITYEQSTIYTGEDNVQPDQKGLEQNTREETHTAITDQHQTDGGGEVSALVDSESAVYVHHEQTTQQLLPNLIGDNEVAVGDNEVAVKSQFASDQHQSNSIKSQPTALCTQSSSIDHESIVAEVDGHQKSYKLTEEIRIDENGREQHIVFLTTDSSPSSAPVRPDQGHEIQPATANSIPTSGSNKSSEACLDTSQLEHIKQSAPLARASKVYSKQNVCTMTPDGQMKQQEVVVEVLVDTGGEKLDLQTVRVLDPTQLTQRLGPESTIQLEASGDIFKCAECNFQTHQRMELIKHNRKQHDDRPHQCPQCSHRARTMSNLKRHILSHTNERKFQCPHCPLRFKQKIHMDKHINYIHKERSVRCQYCDYTCANAVPDLKLHMKRKHLKQHPDDPPTYLECSKCGFLAGSKKDLKQHSKFHKPGPELKLFCEHCSFVTDAKSRLDRHMMIHSKEKPFSCPQCEYKASQKEHIKRHLRTRHGIEEAKTATTKSNVTVTEEAIVTEDLIGEQVISTTEESKDSEQTNPPEKDNPTSSDIVIVNHEPLNRSQKLVKYDPPDYSDKEKLFGCSHCTMKFVRLLSLYKHLHTQHAELLSNAEEDKLTCVVCDFKANSHKALLVHMRKHNSQSEEHEEAGMLYMCVLCKYMNGKRRNLYQHLKKKHKISIIVKKDGTASCVVEPEADVTVVASTQGQEVTEVVGLNAEAINNQPNKVVNIIDLANSLTQKHELPDLIQRVKYEGRHTEQAAAEAIVDLATQSIMQEETMTAVMESDEMGQGQLQLSAQQMHQLSSGDLIEINGETYKIEFQGNSMTAVLCEPQTIVSESTDNSTSLPPPDPETAAMPSVVIDGLPHTSDDVIIEHVTTTVTGDENLVSSKILSNTTGSSSTVDTTS